MHIATFTTIRKPDISRCRSTTSCKHALELEVLRKQNQSQKAKLKELKKENKQKDKKLAELNWELIQSKKANTLLQKKFDKHEATIASLEEELRIARLPKDSSNSSRPPSTDLNKPKRNTNLSLRQKSGKKTGGQPGHKGSTLTFCNDEPDQIITHSPDQCSACGGSLELIAGQIDQVRQVIDIEIPPPTLTNHQRIVKYCSCGHCNKGVFPLGVQGKVNYGPGIRAMVANYSVRQYIPFARIVEMLEDSYKIHISEGTVANIIKGFAVGCKDKYEAISQKVKESTVVGADETSVKVNGDKYWMHTYQTKAYTFIGAHSSRGQVAQEKFFPGGFPFSILVSDCLAMQLSTPAAAHQICFAHLLRELIAMMQAHPEVLWPSKVIELIMDAIMLWKGAPTPKQVSVIEKRLSNLLDQDLAKAPGKIPAFWKRLKKHREKIFLFLQYPDKSVPYENNASERAIRNVKVKVKVSGQFKSSEGAQDYAILRSVIDTANKQRLNIHEELVKIASAQFN